MEYKALYRKYRPTNFDGLIGQDYIKTTLLNAIVSNKLSHAYIFSGPRGTGKTSAAKIFAKAVNCLNSKDGNPCAVCQNCLDFDSSPDVIEIDAASNNGVDEIRELINNVKLAPSYSKYKVYIIDEVHMLSTSAFNALLLTLEEPPGHVIFILATTDIQNVPVTVLSRCQRFDFKPIAAKYIVDSIKMVAKAEKIDITGEAIEEIAYVSEGGLRDAYSILDQLTNGFNNKITIEDVVTTFGTVSISCINELIEDLENNKVSSIVQKLDLLQTDGINTKIFIERFTKQLKNYAINIKLTGKIQRLTYQQIKKMIFDLNEVNLTAKSTINPYSLIQIVLLDFVDDSTIFIQDVVEEKMGKSDIQIDIVDAPEIDDNLVSKVVEEEYLKKLIEIRINNSFVGATKEYLSNMGNLWHNFLKYVKTKNKKMYAYLTDSVIVLASDKYALIQTDSECNSNLINASLDEIIALFEEKFNQKILFISLDVYDWEKEKELYKNNLKGGKKYQLIDELEWEGYNINSEAEQLAKELFGDKLEIN